MFSAVAIDRFIALCNVLSILNEKDDNLHTLHKIQVREVDVL